MQDDELIQKMIAGTYPRIRDIMNAMWREAGVRLALEMPELGPIEEFTDNGADEIIEHLWGAPLSDMAVLLLRSVADEARSGEFIATETAVGAACAEIEDAELRGATGIPNEQIRTVLGKMAEAFIDVVRAHGVIEVKVDRQPIRLRAAA